MSGVLHILHNKTVKFTILSAQGRVWGFVFGIFVNLSVNKLDNYCKKKTSLDIKLKVTMDEG
jgi:hypothetical protein